MRRRNTWSNASSNTSLNACPSMSHQRRVGRELWTAGTVRVPSHQHTSVRRCLNVTVNTVMRAVITIQIVTPVVNALHAASKWKITTPENLFCWQQQFNDFLQQTTNYIACRLWMYSAVECRLHRVDGQYWWKWELLIHSIALSTNISSSSSQYKWYFAWIGHTHHKAIRKETNLYSFDK